MLRNLIPVILPALLIASACERSALDVDVSDTVIPDIRVQRLERDMFALTTSNIDARTQAIKEEYGSLYDHFLMGFLCRRGTSDTAYRRSVLSFTGDKDIKECYVYCQALFPDEKLRALQPGLEDLARHFKYHFPDRRVPNRLVTCLSGWNYAFACQDSAWLLSLDMYLGDTAKFYKMLQYPAYQQRRMSEAYILPDIARGWLLTEFDTSPGENTLLNHTIFYGKLYYAVEALLPDMHDSLLIGYTGPQLDYCRKFERNLWGFFAEKNRLFETNIGIVRELTGEGPFTGAISKECPPRIAMWIGWQVVRSYMERNKKTTLAQLMKMPAQQILDQARYRP